MVLDSLKLEWVVQRSVSRHMHTFSHLQLSSTDDYHPATWSQTFIQINRDSSTLSVARSAPNFIHADDRFQRFHVFETSQIWNSWTQSFTEFLQLKLALMLGRLTHRGIKLVLHMINILDMLGTFLCRMCATRTMAKKSEFKKSMPRISR